MYERITSEADLPRLASLLSIRTMIVDIEPLIAHWDTGQEALDQGVARFLKQVSTSPTVSVVCFATNSARVPSALPTAPGLRVDYLASARKPLRTAPYRGMPVPGVVIGDQVLTDGVLAKRIGYTFLHYSPAPGNIPPGPRLLSGGGKLLRPLFFPRS